MKTWDKYDILRLAFLTKIKKEEQDHIINNFDSFSDYIYHHSQGIGNLASTELFSHDAALIEKKKDEQLEIWSIDLLGITHEEILPLAHLSPLENPTVSNGNWSCTTTLVEEQWTWYGTFQNALEINQIFSKSLANP